MKQQVFFLHSAGAQGKHEGSDDFVSWLKSTLGSDYEVINPIMPNPEDPDYEPWKQALKKHLGSLEGDVVFVGHSLGGAVLLKYLTEEKINATVKGLSLVATPFWGADKAWQYEPFTLPKNARELLPPIPHIFLYHSKSDQTVPFAHLAHYKRLFPASQSTALDGNSHAFENGLPQLTADIKSL